MGPTNKPSIEAAESSASLGTSPEQEREAADRLPAARRDQTLATHLSGAPRVHGSARRRTDRRRSSPAKPMYRRSYEDAFPGS
jgi:hypothetical protein